MPSPSYADSSKVLKKGYQIKWLRVAAKEIIGGIKQSIDDLNPFEVEKLIQLIVDAKDKRIFAIGIGRSGFVAKAFALRLMNLGFNVYVLGETITPAAGKGDLLIAVSGTGTTKMVLSACTAAKEIGACIVAVTSFPASPLGQMADLVVELKGKTKAGVPKEKDYLTRQIIGENEPISPLGSIFENNGIVFFDSLIVELMYRMGQTEADLKRAHATLE
jgi:6-phospho-3-hexuloisomerase